MARSFGAAPNPTGFGNRPAQAGALRKRLPQPTKVDGCRLRVERSANDRARLSKEIKKPRSVSALRGFAISTKNKHLLLSCDTNPRFHGGSFGVLGHTFHKALKM